MARSPRPLAPGGLRPGAPKRVAACGGCDQDRKSCACPSSKAAGPARSPSPWRTGPLVDQAGPGLQERLRAAVEELARLEGDVAVRYERVQRVVNGKAAEVREHGSPYLFDPELGVTRLAGDGGNGLWGRVRTYDITRGTADGVVEHVERVVVLPGGTPAAPAPEPTRQRLADLVTEEERASDPKGAVRYEVVAYLREAPGDRIASRDAVGHDVRYGGRDRAGDLRSELLERRAKARVRMGEDLGRWVERRGGEVRARLPHGLHAVRCAVHADTLEELLDQPDVREIRRTNVPRAGRKDAPGKIYLCKGGDRFGDWDEDASSCTGEKAGYLDARLAAVNAYDYLDRGFDGAGSEVADALGAAWAVSDEPADGGGVEVELPHVTLAIVETDAVFAAEHPAFANGVNGKNRVAFLQGFQNVVFDGENDDPDHPTNLAGVAMGNITDGQDTRITDATARDARSGVARRAMGVFSWVPIDESLSELASTRPVDVVLQAETLNTADPEHECPTEDEQRGLDVNSQAVVSAFLESAVLYVKSAGNLHPASSECDSGSEISAPGAAAVALTVGNLDVETRTAKDMQVATSLEDHSSRTPTPDGRTYPMVVAPGFGCGVAYGWYLTEANCPRCDHEEVERFISYGYDRFTGSSAASATVAGCALLFKHWYLSRYPVQANVAGRLLSNLLNMADGYTGEGSTVVPAVGWGLGRFRLRLFEDEGMSGDWARATTRVDLQDGEVEQIDLGSILVDGTRTFGFDGGGEVPSSATRLRVTIWWLEPNTGEGEDKAEIQAILGWDDADRHSAGWSIADSAGNNVIRLQFDTVIPSGRVWLNLTGTIPTARRYIYGSRRHVYVSWFWESGADLSLITCLEHLDGTPEGVRPGDVDVAGLGGLSTPTASTALMGVAEAERWVEALRERLEENAVLRPGARARVGSGPTQVRA